jgi:hypothetical protein
MALTAKPNTFSNGTVAQATEVNANFDAIFNDYNGNITDANIAIAGITTYGKVQGSSLSVLSGINSGAGTIPITNIPYKDEDNMVSNSATSVPTQQSAKAYVDGKFSTSTGHDHDGTDSKLIAGTNISSFLGAWVDKSASYAAQQAATDGFVTVIGWASTNGGTDNIYGYSDVNADPTTERGRIYTDSGTTNIFGSFMFPVKKSDYWKVVRTGSRNAPTVYWIPLGS